LLIQFTTGSEARASQPALERSKYVEEESALQSMRGGNAPRLGCFGQRVREESRPLDQSSSICKRSDAEEWSIQYQGRLPWFEWDILLQLPKWRWDVRTLHCSCWWRNDPTLPQGNDGDMHGQLRHAYDHYRHPLATASSKLNGQ